jgi:chromate reductase
MKPRVLILNASLGGSLGNTAVLLARAEAFLRRRAQVSLLTLNDSCGFTETRPALERADAIIIGSGTHWDSWSHHLQKFLEEGTSSEGTSLWLGKPAAVVITTHAVGGKGVLSRLQGVLSTLGCVIPPMSGLVYSLANQAALSSAAAGAEDLWSPADIDVIGHNLLAALKPKPNYKAWPVDRTHFSARWIVS